MQNAARLWPLPLIAGGTRKRILRRRLSRIARDGARVHSPQPYADADVTALEFIWNHIFLNVSDFAKGSCFGSAFGSAFGISLVFPGSSTASVTVTQVQLFPRHFCGFLRGGLLGDPPKVC